MARMFLLKSLLEEAHALDNLEKRQQSARIRSLPLLTRDDDYVSIYRLSKELIDQLESDLLPLIKPTKRRGKGLTTRVKILCTLSFLASGSYQKVIKEGIRTYLSQPSASRCINEVVEALNNPAVVKKYIRFPQNQQERQSKGLCHFVPAAILDLIKGVYKISDQSVDRKRVKFELLNLIQE
nr:uncharacterized protein LOC126055278 [Helicoverpa armigera]XP_049707585.1 uncharacterized protein LOC126056918 [Helicoverpa armigera]